MNRSSYIVWWKGFITDESKWSTFFRECYSSQGCVDCLRCLSINTDIGCKSLHPSFTTIKPFISLDLHFTNYNGHCFRNPNNLPRNQIWHTFSLRFYVKSWRSDSFVYCPFNFILDELNLYFKIWCSSITPFCYNDIWFGFLWICLRTLFYLSFYSFFWRNIIPKVFFRVVKKQILPFNRYTYNCYFRNNFAHGIWNQTIVSYCDLFVVSYIYLFKKQACNNDNSPFYDQYSFFIFF